MKLIKPKFWIIRTSIYIFYPLTIIIYKNMRSLSKKEFKIQTICIGNITAGGTGKTFWLLN